MNENPLTMDITNEAIISFEYQNEEGEQSHSAAAFFENSNESTILQLVPGKYDISGTLLNNDEIIIYFHQLSI